MRFLVLALVLMMVASAMAIRKEAKVVEEIGQKRMLEDDQGDVNLVYNNHHAIPRKDWGKHVGSININGNGVDN